MLCDKCKKNVATFHSRTIINGVETNEHLCSECAKKLKKDNFNFEPFHIFDDVLDNSFLSDSFDNIGYLPSIFDDDVEEYDDYKDKGIISDALTSVKKGAKNYKKENEGISPEFLKLKNELHDAVEKEDYEKAAQLKKKMEEIKDNKDKKGDK